MSLLRWSPVLVALLFGLGACRNGSSERSDAKPDVSAKPAEPPELKLPGFELGSFTPRERKDWSSQVSSLLAPCADTPVPLSQCILEKRTCKACVPAAQFLLDQVKAGRTKAEREEAYAGRFDPKKIKSLVLDGSPELGSPDAPVTIVEFADFECPACKAFYPLLDMLEKRFHGQVRIVYKFFPLAIHAHGELAARAGYSAARQDKFWAMHHLLFDNQDRLEQDDLEGYAKDLKLDIPKFRKEMGTDDTLTRIDKDKKQGESLGLQGTPSIFINGREVELGKLIDPYPDLENWIKLDLELAGVTPVPPPAAGSAVPAGGPAVPAGGSAVPAGGPAKPIK